jgi:predicted transcriptional regulator
MVGNGDLTAAYDAQTARYLERKEDALRMYAKGRRPVDIARFLEISPRAVNRYIQKDREEREAASLKTNVQ